MIVLFILVAIPLIEIAFMIKVGQWIGFWPAFGLVVATFLVGATIVGRSGFTSAIKVRDALARGEPPVGAMVDSTLVAIAGVLLMTPGFLADIVGLALLIPPLRRWLTAYALRNATVIGSVRTEQTTSRREPPSQDRRPDTPQTGAGPVIEGEFERLDERPLDPRTRRPRTDGDP